MLEKYALLARYVVKESPDNLQQYIKSIEYLRVALKKTMDSIKDDMVNSLDDRSDSSLELHKLYIFSKEVLQTMSDILRISLEAYENPSDTVWLTNTGEDNCLTDTTRRHSLSEDFGYCKVCAIEMFGQRYDVSNWQDALVKFCEILAQKDKPLFLALKDTKEFRGRKNVYFMDAPVTGKTKRVPGTNVYVWVNHSANKIVELMRKLLFKYKIKESTVYIYIRADYSSRH